MPPPSYHHPSGDVASARTASKFSQPDLAKKRRTGAAPGASNPSLVTRNPFLGWKRLKRNGQLNFYFTENLLSKRLGQLPGAFEPGSLGMPKVRGGVPLDWATSKDVRCKTHLPSHRTKRSSKRHKGITEQQGGFSTNRRV